MRARVLGCRCKIHLSTIYRTLGSTASTGQKEVVEGRREPEGERKEKRHSSSAFKDEH